MTESWGMPHEHVKRKAIQIEPLREPPETDAAHGHNIVMALVQCIGHFAAVADVSFPALVRQRHDTWRLRVDAKVTLV